MRAAVFVSIFAAGVLAQDSVASSAAASTVVEVSSVPYSNPATQYLTQTNSLGVVTGMPAVETSQPANPDVVTTQPAVVTTQPAAASIPAGLPSGFYTIPYGNTTSFIVSVGISTTAVITPVTPSSTPTGAEGTGADGAGSQTTTGSAPNGSQTGAAAAVKVASGALVGAGALFAAFL